MKLPFKRVKEIITEEIDSLSVIEEGVWNFEIAQPKGTSGAEKHVKASTSDIEFEWGRKDRNSKYGMDPYLRWAPTGKGGKFSTLGELQWRGDPFTYEKITGSSRSNPKARVVTGPSSMAHVLGKVATIKSQPRIDAWWEPREIIHHDETPIVANLEDQDDLPTPEKKAARPEVEEEIAGYGMYKNLASAVLKLRGALRKDWEKDGLDYDTEPENVYSLLLRVNDAIFGPWEVGSLNFGGHIPPEKVRAAVARAVNKITMLVLGVGPNLKKYYVATGSDPFAGYLMSDKVRDLTFDVVTRSTDLVNDLAKLAPGIGVDDLYKIYNGPPEGSSGRWWQYEEERAVEEEAELGWLDRAFEHDPEYRKQFGKNLPDLDLDGDGILDSEDDDYDGDGKPNKGDWKLNIDWDDLCRRYPNLSKCQGREAEEEEEEIVDDEEEDTGDYQESFKISPQRLSQLIKEELQLIVEAQDPQTQDTGEEYLGVAAPAIKADKTKRLRTMRASIAALTSKINQECGASGDSSSCDSDKDQLSDLQAQEQELAQS